MGLNKIGIFFAKLSLSPLCLTHATAIWLVNMVALELSTTHCKDEESAEESAVCSYPHLFSMLVHREEDVQEPQTRSILKGAGLTNKEALEFFTSFQNVPHRSYSANIMVDIEIYRVNRGTFLSLPLLTLSLKVLHAVVASGG
jgi:hypothetical protein